MLPSAMRYLFGSVAAFGRDLFRNRQLIARMAGYELRSRYASTAIGALWALFQPILLIAVFWFVATRGLKVSFDSGTPYVLMMFTLSGATNSIANYSYLVRKVAFPVHILPAVTVCAAVMVHAVLFLVLLGMLAWYGVFPGARVFLVLFYLAGAMLFTLGLGWLLAAANVFSRDIGQAVGAMLNVLFWATPILWPADHIQGLLKTVLQLNPMFYVVQGYRYALLPGVAPVSFGLEIYFWTLTLAILIAGAAVFRRFEADFADVLR
jgi:ABC-type polysaccharide/polyol phosphate export permease